MALEDLTPVTRTEAILDGDDISPVTRMEYFLEKAANEVPKPDGVSDAGKVLTVNAAGDGFELDTSLPEYTSADNGKVLTLGEGSESETVVIVPEQTVTIVDAEVAREVPLPDVDPSLIVIGETVTFIVNGVATTDTVTANGIDGAESSYIYVNAGVVTFGDENSGDYVISLTKSVPVVEPKWEEIVELPELPSANGNYNLHIASGVASWVPVAP